LSANQNLQAVDLNPSAVEHIVEPEQVIPPTMRYSSENETYSYPV
jgi:hypothetical protein